MKHTPNDRIQELETELALSHLRETKLQAGQSAPPPPPPPPTLRTLSTLEALRISVSAPAECKLPIRDTLGQPEVAIVMCRMPPPELVLELDLLVRSVIPPNRKTRPDEPDRWDENDPDYIKRKGAVEHEVRCLIVWHCCTLFDETRTGPGKDWQRNAITKFVCEQIPDDMGLRLLAGQLSTGSLSDRVSFT